MSFSVHVRYWLSIPYWAFVSLSVVACGSTGERRAASTSGGSTGGTGSGGSSSDGRGGVSGAGGTDGVGGAGASASSGASSGFAGRPGSGGTMGGEGGAMPGSESDLFAPRGIELHPPPIELPGLTMTAYTLRDGDEGLELYVALRNDAATPACGASISVDLYDHDGQSLASSVIGIVGGSPYQLSELPDRYSACVTPGRVAMAALTDWPAEVSVDAVGHLAYRCPYFELLVTPAGELPVSNVEKESTAEGDSYRGTLTNQLTITVASPEVVIFPLAESGRPLGMLSVQGAQTLTPGDSWRFESAPIEVRGADAEIFPSVSLPSSDD